MRSHTIPQLKILVVDDDAMTQQMLKLLMMQRGHDVSLAANGVEAVECVKSDQFDIVLMDLQMPIMDGVEATANIREWEKGKAHTFIVALTASYLPEDGQKLFDAGIDNYIAKPFDVEHIERMLKYRSASNTRIADLPGEAPLEETEIKVILDIPRGLKQIGSSAETYWSLLDDFVEEIPERMSTLQDALTRQDLDTVSRAAHNLKAVSANLGALQLSKYANRLDRASGQGYTEQSGMLMERIRYAGAELQRVAELLLSDRRSNENE